MSAYEQWRPVVGYEGYYEVSDHGQVRSLDREVQHPVGGLRRQGGVLLRLTPARTGYTHVSLHRGGRRRVQVHVLVLAAFVGPRPADYVACHYDGNRSNNALSNLRWDTPSNNNRDSVRHGTHASSRKTHCPRGHAYSTENTYVSPAGVRDCRTCRRVHLANSRARRKAAVA